MKRAMVGMLMLAACLLFGSALPTQAATTDQARLSALYNAIFVEEPAPDSDAAAAGNIWCCVPASAACVSTSKDKCLKKVADGGYEGKAFDTYLDCKNAGCQ